MISRCPSCGAPAPDEARLCRACGWDFVANKKSDKKPEGDKKPGPPPPKAPPPPPPKSSAPPAQAGFSLPAARGGDAPPAAKPPKAGSGAFASPSGDENPFALPVARNLGPKPGESLFSAPPPPPAPPKLPAAKPSEPEEEEEPAEPEPPKKAEPVKKAESPKKPAPKKEEEPPAEEPEPKGESLPSAPPPAELEEAAEADEPPPSAALFLPASTDEIVVEPEKRPAEPAPLKERLAAAAKKEAAAEKDAPRRPAKKEPAPTGKAEKPARQSAVYLAALAGGALGLLSIGAVFMLVRPDPQAAPRAVGASPFGKRSAGDATLTPNIDAPVNPPSGAPGASLTPAPTAHDDAPPPTSLPAPSLSRPIEPPKPGSDSPAPVSAPVVSVPAPTPAPAPAPAPAPKAATPPPEAAPVPEARPTAHFAQAPRPPAPATKPGAKAPPAPKAKPKPKGPQWTFEGTVYDLLSTKGVFGAKLVFVDADDNEVASVETGSAGKYSVTMPAGPAEGYQLHIIHDDYSGKHIDELDSTSSVRKADLEQRKFLMLAGARSLPWIGTAGHPVRRDMALVPRAAAE